MSSSGALERAQRLFFRAITWPRGVRDFLEHADEATRRQFEETFATGSGLDRVGRMDVYADAYFYRLLSALAEMFPRLAYLGGDVGFHDLVTDYVLHHPSVSPDLRRLGERLPELVRRHPLGQSLPLLADVASLEAALSGSLDCPCEALVTEGDLSGIPQQDWPGLRLELSTPALLLESEWDLELVAALCARGERAQALALPRGPRRLVLVGRRGHVVYFRQPNASEARALFGFQAGASFAAVCADLALHVDGFEPSLMVADLRRWLEDELIGRVCLERSESIR